MLSNSFLSRRCVQNRQASGYVWQRRPYLKILFAKLIFGVSYVVSYKTEYFIYTWAFVDNTKTHCLS